MISIKPILIAGFGSIGRRHLRNLQSLGCKNIILLRTGKSTLPDDEIKDIKTEYSLQNALAHQPFATIVSNPTALHMKVALAAAKAGSHLFLEKPVSHDLRGIEELQKLVKEKNLIVAVGYQFRFHPDLQRIKRSLEKNRIGQVSNVQVHWGEYLPSWHPWEDYKKSYSANKKLGGGVLLTLCHPFDYLRWLFGEVLTVSALQSNSRELGIDAEDSADILLKFNSGVIGNVHLDYLERPTNHFIHIIGQNGIIHWNFTDSLNIDRNQIFFTEMRQFLNCIKSKKQPDCNLNDGIAALRIVLAAKQSAKTEKLVKLR